MFFEDAKDIEKIAKKTGCAIFVLPNNVELKIKNALLLEPDKKTTITIDQVRDVFSQFLTKKTEDFFVVVRPADKLGEEAANAFLKNLEEPKDKVHYILITEKLSAILPTIRSRASIYFYRNRTDSFNKISADEKVKELAKKFLVAKPIELLKLADEVAKHKDNTRNYALEVLAVAVEMSYKTYLITGKKVFLNKSTKFIAAYENISKNGHIKLHLVADLL